MSAAHSIDDYLQAMFELQEEGHAVVQARIAKRLGVSRASVSEQVARLQKMRLISIDRRQITMTPHGNAVAEDAVKRHRLAERFLTDVLKMPWHLAHQEANRFQAGLTDEIGARMLAMIEGPATCPHGNPIPGTGAQLDRAAIALHEVNEGDTVVLVRLLEDFEFDTDALRYFEENGLVPGARFRVESKAADGSILVKQGKRQSSVSAKLTDNVFVKRD